MTNNKVNFKYNEFVANHLVNDYDWGERRFQIASLIFDREITKSDLLTLLRGIIVSKYNKLKDHILYYEKSTVSYINDGFEDTNYLYYDIEDKRKFNLKALPYLRPQILIIDMSDIKDTGTYSHYCKFEWVSKYLTKHRKHSAIQTTVIICTNKFLDDDEKGFNLNEFLLDTADIVFKFDPTIKLETQTIKSYDK